MKDDRLNSLAYEERLYRLGLVPKCDGTIANWHAHLKAGLITEEEYLTGWPDSVLENGVSLSAKKFLALNPILNTEPTQRSLFTTIMED